MRCATPSTPSCAPGDLWLAQHLAQSAERVEGGGEAAERGGLDHRLDHLGAAQPHIERRLAELLHLAVELERRERRHRDQRPPAQIEGGPEPVLAIAVLYR